MNPVYRAILRVVLLLTLVAGSMFLGMWISCGGDVAEMENAMYLDGVIVP
jgi:membrane protein involved in colicin uptake